MSYPAWRAIGSSRQFGVGRWDGDGSPDTLYQVGNTLKMYAGNGPGGLTGGRTLSIDVSRYNWVGGIRNLRGKGHPALIVRNRNTGDLWTIAATSTKFGKPRFLGEGFQGYDLMG